MNAVSMRAALGVRPARRRAGGGFIREISMPNPKKPWLGHYPITLLALEALEKQLSDNAAPTPPQAAKVLFIACAFWAAVAMETLEDYLGKDRFNRLQSAHAACVEIGAITAAAVILRHLDALAQERDAHNDKRDLTVSALEKRLADADGDMDELIAQLAANILSSLQWRT